MRNLILCSLFIALNSLSAQIQGARYLIITHDSYADALKPLADWKTQKGIKAKIVTLSDIGGSDSISIRNYVINAYNNWSMKPEYLLLVGNKYQIPFPKFTYPPNTFYSDNYYTSVAGNFQNEILPGRFWVFDTLTAKTIVAKVLNYEKFNQPEDTIWVKKGTTIVCEDYTGGDTTYWGDARYAHNLMINAGFIHIDSLAESRGDSSREVLNAINDGRSYILYRGGAWQFWQWPFDQIDTAQMCNGFKLPVVISATCGTVDGIGYIWQVAGVPEQPKGVVGFLGSTTALMAPAEFYRRALARGTLNNIFFDSLSTLGKACEAGRLNYYSIFNDSLEYQSWTCLGDPNMNLRTGIPRITQITTTPPVWAGDTLSVIVRTNNQPMPSALVCIRAISDTNFYHYGYTDNQGMVKFIDNLYYPDTGLITVTGRNIFPGFDTIPGGFTGGPYVQYESHVVLDTAVGGNGNFQPNNGETFELAVWIKNFGDSTARGVTAILQKAESDSYYDLNDTIKQYGLILSQDSSFTGADGFNVTVDPYCPDSHLIKLKMTMTDTLGTEWQSYFKVLIFSPRPYLKYKYCIIEDSTGGNHDHRVNPAENIEMPLWIANIGDSIAINVQGWLRKTQPDLYFDLSDTVKSFGDILSQDSAWTGSDGFNISVDSQCPDLHELKIRVTLGDSLDSTWIYDFILINHAPRLVLYDYFFDDTVKYILHGDTAIITVYLKNSGSLAATEVAGHIINTDTFLTVIQGDAQFNPMLPESIGSNISDPFVICSRANTPAGYSTSIKLALSSGPYRDTVDFTVFIGQRDYLVWDPDPNHSSGFMMHQKLIQLHYLGDYQQTFPNKFLNVYRTLFVYLGVSPYKHIVYDTCSLIPEMIHFLAAGGRTYMEGGDVWYNDTAIGGYNFCPIFNLNPISGSSGYYTQVLGDDSIFTGGMNFPYTGETQSIDRIEPINIGKKMLKRPNTWGCGVAANHRTIGLSIEFSGLVDSVPPSTKMILADSIMRYFGITPSGGIAENEMQTTFSRNPFLDVYPNPARNSITIRYLIRNPGSMNKNVSFYIYDIAGRLVKSLSFPSTLGSKPSTLIWDGTDCTGRTICTGIYFVCMQYDDSIYKRKVVIIRH